MLNKITTEQAAVFGAMYGKAMDAGKGFMQTSSLVSSIADKTKLANKKVSACLQSLKKRGLVEPQYSLRWYLTDSKAEKKKRVFCQKIANDIEFELKAGIIDIHPDVRVSKTGVHLRMNMTPDQAMALVLFLETGLGKN